MNKIDVFSRFGAFMMVFIFLSNDIIATTRFVVHGVPTHHKRQYTAPVYVSNYPTDTPHVDVFGNDSNSEIGQLQAIAASAQATAPVIRRAADAEDFEVLSENVTLIGYKVTQSEAAVIPTHLVNVTRRAYAYRMDGNNNEGYHIAIGVDASKVRSQSEMNEVQVFFFDKTSQTWKRAHVVTVDHEKLRVEAVVPGETDYFAGLIKSPDMPEAGAYVPTNISDIEPANPATGMRLMQAPSANRMGTANMNYPLWIPQGRNGMTPQVSVTYNSDQGTGWMGMGWNMGASSISVDTKWGVPEYDTQIETEPYVLDGEALFMEGNKRANRPTLDTNGQVVPLTRETGTVRFFPRVMSSYSEIERKGTSPSNYYWIVTDASQTKRYYGSIDGTTQDTGSVLKTAAGEVAQWYLSRVEDKWGNTMDYEYQKFEEGTTTNMKSGGKNRVLKKITYTGFNGTSYEVGKYSVEFHTSDTRGDGRVTMNLGLKHVDDRRLDSVSAYYDTQLLVRYKFTYKRDINTFFKTVLTAIQEYRSGQLFYEHTFDYYEDPIDYEGSVALNTLKADPWLRNSSDNPFFEPIREGLLRVLSPSALNTSITGGYSVGGSLGGGITTNQGQNKNGTFSVGIGFDQNWTSTTRSMRDINGDGLADLLFEDYEGNFSYSPVAFEDGQFTVGGRREFGTEGIQRSSNTSFRTNIDYRSTGGYFVGFNWNTSTNKDRRTLTDYNADGVPDLLVNDGTATPAVQFGLRDSKGDITFSQSSEHTLNPVIKGVNFNLADDGDFIKEFQVVRSWKAPASGVVSITGTASVREGLSGEGAVGIQHNSTFITEGFEEVTPTVNHTSLYSIEVAKGDLILFRTISRDDGQEDFIEWNPKVEYTSGSFTDGNGTAWSGSFASDGFLLSGREGVSVKGDWEFKINLNLSVNSTLTDNVYLVMQPYIDGVPQTPITDVLPIGGPYTTSNLNAYGFVGGYDSFDSYTGYSSTDDVSFKFSLWSTSNVDWDEISFRPVVKFDDDCKVANEQYPLVDYETFNEIEILEGDQYRPSTSTTYYEVIPQITVNTTDIDNAFGYSSQDEDGIVYMTVKSGGNFLSRVAVHFKRDYSTPANNTIEIHPMTASTGAIDYGTTLSFSTYNNDSDVKFLGSQIVSDRLFVEFHGTGPAAEQLASYLNTHLFRLRFLSTGSNQTVGGTDPNKNIYYRTFSEFNMHHLSWGRFAWSPADPEVSEAAIDTSYLHSRVLENARSNYSNLTDSTYLHTNRDNLNPINDTFFVMGAIRGEKAFGLRSYHKALGAGSALDRYSVFGTYMGEYQTLSGISSGYLGEEESDAEALPSEPGVNPSYTARGALNYSRSSTLGITGGYGSTSISAHFAQKDVFYSRSKRQFLDINGDRYPDVLNESNDVVTIYPTNYFGSHTNGITSHGLSDYLGKGTSFGVAASAGGSIGIESGAYLNVDPRFEIITKESSIPLSGSVNLGRQRTRTEFIDINGDGLLDEYYDDVESWSSASPTFMLNAGGTMQSPSFDAEDRINRSSFTISASGAISTVTTTVSMWEQLLSIWFGTGPVSKDSKSWEIGAGVNYAVNQSERIYLDLTGDGLVDYLEYDTDFFNDKIRIYINEGYEFAYYGEISTDPIDEQISKNTGLGFSGKITGTGAFSLWGLKIKGSLTGNGDVSVNRLQNSFMDMNGDGTPDYVEHAGQSNLQVYMAKFSRNGKLKTVHNPLGGSFTISYDAEGQKSGFYEPQVKMHLSDETNEKMIWDMPQGKLVMASVTVNDGLDVTDNGVDLDGDDESIITFAYDGGIHSRRERQFLGFTRVATITESHIHEDMNEEYLKDYCDYDNIESPRNVDHLYSSPEMPDWDSTKVDTVSRYNMSVMEFSRPSSLEKDELFSFNYLSKLPETSYQLHVHEWIDSMRVMQLFPPDSSAFVRYDRWNHSHIELISESNPDYEIRLVDTDPTSEFFGQVTKELDAWYVVENLNELDETSTIFPAVTEVKKVSFPVVEDRDHYNASKSTLEYDEYFNVVRYEDAGTGVATTPDTVVVDTMFYTHYVYKTQIDSCSQIATFDTVYNDGLIYGLLIPWASTGNYEDAVAYGMFAPNACLPDSLPSDFLCGEGESTFTTTHRGTQTDTIYIKEINYNATYTGNLIAEMEYFPPSVNTSNQTNVLETHKVYKTSTINANLMRWSKVLALEDDLAPGNIAQYLSTSASPPASETAESLIRYTKYGLVDSLVGPENLNAQRAFRTFSYDTDVHQFVTQVVNEHSDTACSTYDLGHQLMLQSVDPNGHPMRYEYDDNQRMHYVWAPREIYNTTNGPTIEFDYYPEGEYPQDTASGDVPVAFTYHNTGNKGVSVTYAPSVNYCENLISTTGLTKTMASRVTTATLTDGMDQPVQIQTISDWDNPGDTVHTMADRYRVSGIAEKNQFGLTTTTRNDTLLGFTNIGRLVLFESSIVSQSEYDYVTRPVKQTGLWAKTGVSGDELDYIENTITYLWHGYDSDMYFATKTNVASATETYSITDSRGRNIANEVDDLVGTLPNATTHFRYDPLNQLIETEDPIGDTTSFTYDNFGRVIREIHPDRDTTLTDYDLAGNVETIQTAVTKPNYISFDYDYNRMIEKTMPATSLSGQLYNARYTYGTKGDGKNGAGRIITVEQGDTADPVLTHTIKYDELGQTSVSTKQYAVPMEGYRTFTTQSFYDSFGRILQLIYPDGEEVNYTYSDLGSLTSITTLLSGVGGSVINDITYDGFDNIAFMEYGNGTQTTYRYHDHSRTLMESTVDANMSGGFTTALDRDYTYGNRGMITSLTRDVHTDLTGSDPSTHIFDFTYDGMNRLESTDFNFQDSTVSYSIDMAYNEAGGITTKTSNVVSAGNMITTAMDYNSGYTYSSIHPHQVKSIYDAVSQNTSHIGYNDVGSMSEIELQNKFGGTVDLEKYRWNEEQMMVADSNDQGIHHYVYDYTGERIMKSSFTSSTVWTNDTVVDVQNDLAPYKLYVDPYLVESFFSNANQYTKHYYMGMTRIMTDISLYEVMQEETKVGYIDTGTENQAESRTAQNSETFNDPVFEDLKVQLREFGILENVDYTETELKEPPSLEEMYPEYANTTENHKGGEFTCCFEGLRFWYHPDYLGSVDLVTDAEGNVHQFFLYNPWGENMYTYTSTSYGFDSDFKFNGKEFDEETELGYYGARYYQNRLSVWLSVDAMANKGPEFTPYSFTFNNPLMSVDPDGNWPDWLDRAWNWLWGNSEPETSVEVGQMTAQGIPLEEQSSSGLVFEISGKLDVGPQIGVNTPFAKGKLNVGSVELASGTYNFLTGEMTNTNYIGDGDGTRVSHSASIEVGIPVKIGPYQPAVGAYVVAEQNVRDVNGIENGGYVSSGYEVSGDVYIGPRRPSTTSTSGISSPNTNGRANIKGNSDNFIGLDFSLGATFILGANMNVKFGYKY